MLGRNEAERARSLALCSWLASTVHPAFARFVRRKCFSGDEASQAAVRESARQTYWELLERPLARTALERESSRLLAM